MSIRHNLFIVRKILFCGLVVSLTASACPLLALPQDDALYKSIVSAVNSRSMPVPTIISNIDTYVIKNPDSVYCDDLELVKAILLREEKKYVDSNQALARLLKEHPFPQMEKDLLKEVPLLPAQWLQLDTLTYINNIRANNYKDLNDMTQAAVNYESVMDHINKESVFRSALQSQLAEVCYNLAEVLIKQKSIIKAKRIIKDYINDSTNSDPANKDRLQALLNTIQNNYGANRDPFLMPRIMSEGTPVLNAERTSANANSKIKFPGQSRRGRLVYVTGIMIDNERTVIFQQGGSSIVKQQGQMFDGYRILLVGEKSVTLGRGNTKVNIKLGEGRSL